MSANERALGPRMSMEEAAAFLESDAESLEEFERRKRREEQAKGAAEPETRRSRRERVAAALASAREAAGEAARGKQRDLQEASGEARRKLARAAAAHAEDIRADKFVDRRRKSRNQQLAERAQHAATVAPITDHTLDTLGASSRRPEEMARASVEMAEVGLEGGGPEAGVGTGVDARVGSPPLLGPAPTRGEPDWDDNPEHLDTAAEVRADLLEAGLDPMDLETEQEALFGHALVHKFADDPDLGGRTPAQLEAEHDMVVDRLDDFGFEHHTPLDVGVIGLLEGGD